jgi:hypothetical protein
MMKMDVSLEIERATLQYAWYVWVETRSEFLQEKRNNASVFRLTDTYKRR